MAKRNRHTATPRCRATARRAADAFRDATRDILRTDGELSLADARDPHLFWHFDGLTWRTEHLPPPRRRRHLEPRTHI